jgi:hypothetical protein
VIGNRCPTWSEVGQSSELVVETVIIGVGVLIAAGVV